MEVEFFAGVLNFRVKRKVNPNQKISHELNKVIKENSILSTQNFNLILCQGGIVDPQETFKNNKLKSGCVLVLLSKSLDESTEIADEEPLKFSLNKCITKHSHVNLKEVDLNAFIDRTFTVFKSIKNEYLLIYSYSEDYKNYSLKCYDILQDKKKTKVQKAHTERIFTCSHFLDKKNKRDLLITSAFDKKIKIWNITNNFQIIYEKKPDYYYQENTYLLSESILSDNANKIYLIVSAYEIESKGYDLLYYNTSQYLDWGSFENSRDNTNFLDVINNNKNPEIITANLGNVKIYNFQNKKLIKFFHDNNNQLNYLSAIVKYDSLNNINLIVSAGDGLLRIWDYNNPENLIQKIKIYLNIWLIGLELINERYLLAAGADGNIKEFDLKKNYMACNLNRNNPTDPLFTLRYININGENYLFSHSHKGLIELWK